MLLREQVNRCNKSSDCLGIDHFSYAIADFHSFAATKAQFQSNESGCLAMSNTDYSGQMTAVIFASIIAFNWSADEQICSCDMSRRTASRPKNSNQIDFHKIPQRVHIFQFSLLRSFVLAFSLPSYYKRASYMKRKGIAIFFSSKHFCSPSVEKVKKIRRRKRISVECVVRNGNLIWWEIK